MNPKVCIIGAGFASLSAAAHLAKAGYSVSVYEKNKHLGGRARQLVREGFTFDMGPSYYWMPEVIEEFFSHFSKKVSDMYDLKRLNTAYRVFFDSQQPIDIKGRSEEVLDTFERIEKGASDKLFCYLHKAGQHYQETMGELVSIPGESITELASTENIRRLRYFLRSLRKEIQNTVDHPSLRKILEFPSIFLGAKPNETPAYYSLMNFADLAMRNWHPVGGISAVAQAIVDMCKELGVEFHTEAPVQHIAVRDNRVSHLLVHNQKIDCDILLSGADYHHTEGLLDSAYRQYSQDYWDNRSYSPSALLFYAAFDMKIPGVAHHSLFLDSDFEANISELFEQKCWPEKPFFCASFPSITDPSAAPPGKEAATFLLPISTGLSDDSEQRREAYFNQIISRLSEQLHMDLSSKVLFYESYCIQEFKRDYNSYGGTAFGLASTPLQTHVMRPKMKSKKLDNMYFTGHMTVPGPGLPPSLISGKIASNLIQKYHAIEQGNQEKEELSLNG